MRHTVHGQILLVEEQRFRLVSETGQGLLFTLARQASIDVPQLEQLAASGAPVIVEYEGEPDLASAAALDVQPVSDGSLAGPSRWARLQGALRNWSVPKQWAGADPMGAAAQTDRSRGLRPRLEAADRIGTSICPYCAVGCAQLIYAKGNHVLHIEGDPRSPINQGTLCPKGAATFGWMVNPNRLTRVKYRAPFSDHWEERPLDWAMERIAQLVKQARDETFVRSLPDGTTVNHTMAVAELGGATLDNEENYLIKKLCGGGLGMVWIENQARV